MALHCRNCIPSKTNFLLQALESSAYGVKIRVSTARDSKSFLAAQSTLCIWSHEESETWDDDLVRVYALDVDTESEILKGKTEEGSITGADISFTPPRSTHLVSKISDTINKLRMRACGGALVCVEVRFEQLCPAVGFRIFIDD